MPALFPLLMLVACGDKDAADDTGVSVFDDTGSSPIDSDGDGYDETVDCDDADAAIHPGADELCDEIDNDCDGDIDEGAQSTFYADDDGDGYGDSTDTIEACTAPASTVPDGGDCDDTEATVYPGAEEVCWDGVVNDCDGDASSAAQSCAFAEVVAEADADRSLGPSGAALSQLSSGDLDGDGIVDLAYGAARTDTAYVHLGPLSSGGTALTLSGTGASGLGAAVAVVPDLDGDGYDELLLGGDTDDSGGGRSGTAWLLMGPVTGGSVESQAASTFAGITESQLGFMASAVGDMDDDGIDDLVLGAPYYGSSYEGVLVVASGAARGTVDVDDATIARLQGLGYSSGVGLFEVASDAGDIDGDGIDDLVMSGPALGDGSGVFVFLGPVSGALDTDEADGRFLGDSDQHSVGVALAAGIDLDGDGAGDLVASTPDTNDLAEYGGSIFGITGGLLQEGSITELADFEIQGSSERLFLGYTLDIGDVDGDGTPDLLAGTGAAWVSGSSVGFSGGGSAYLFYGDFSGSLTEADADVAFEGSSGNFGRDVQLLGRGGAPADVAVLSSSGAGGQVWLFSTGSY